MLLAYKAEISQKKIYVWLIVLFLVFIAGFRGEEVGIDTPNYIEIWDRLLIGGIAYQEVGFQFIITSLQHITDNPTYMFLVCSSIIYPLIIFRLWDFRKVASFTFMIAMFFFIVLFALIQRDASVYSIGYCILFLSISAKRKLFFIYYWGASQCIIPYQFVIGFGIFGGRTFIVEIPE